MLPSTEMRALDLFRMRLNEWLHEPKRTSGAREALEMRAAIGTEIGLVRKENQDRAVIAQFAPLNEPSFTVAILCDGIGGAAHGGICADIAVREVVAALSTSHIKDHSIRLLQAVHLANREVYREFGGKSGTTIVAILLVNDTAFGVSAGDSKIYSHTGRELSLISHDDTIAGELSRIRGHEKLVKNLEQFSTALAQFVGVGGDFEPRIYQFDRVWDTRFILMSDGIPDWTAPVVGSFLQYSHSAEQFVSRCLALSRWTGGHDNASVICMETLQQKQLLNESHLTRPYLRVWDAFSRVDFYDEGLRDTPPPPMVAPRSRQDTLVNEAGADKRKAKRKAKVTSINEPSSTSKEPPSQQRILHIDISPNRSTPPQTQNHEQEGPGSTSQHR